MEYEEEKECEEEKDSEGYSIEDPDEVLVRFEKNIFDM